MDFCGLVNATDVHGEADFENLTVAFRLAARNLADKINRQAEIKSRTDYVERCFSLRVISDGEWITVARQAGLPGWVVEVWPKIFDVPDEGDVTVWKPILTTLSAGYSVRESFCEGVLVRITPDELTRKHIRQMLPLFEAGRRKTLDGSARARFVMLNHIFLKLEDQFEQIREARQLLLKEALANTRSDPAEFDRVSDMILGFVRERYDKGQCSLSG